tara:strand:- start:547 stop:2781 length:2235 start_codon:yes stop_codon:yes gene_type:complete
VRYFYFFLFIYLGFGSGVGAQVSLSAQDSVVIKSEQLKEVLLMGNAIIGNKFKSRNKTGSSIYLSKGEIQKYGFTDINRTLQSIPGVNSYEEDGFGLRPNISLRGTSPERSAKINLMEDGVLIAPAPYSAPAAYYFPTMARMEALEIVKGSSQIQYGPNTTGGAINMITAVIPDKFSGNVSMARGNYHSGNHQVTLGDSGQNFGYLANYLNYYSGGFKYLDGGGATGFDRSDYMIKLRGQTDSDAAVYQSLTGKIHYFEEQANETYLGLTDHDFERTPYRRYKASAKDVMDALQQQIQLTHVAQFSPTLSITTNAYLNKLQRNWYKLDDVTLAEKVGISAVLMAPDQYPLAYQALLGAQDTAPDVLGVKANNRRYLSTGIQSVARWTWGQNWRHTIEFGARYHYDYEDRFQWVDRYGFEQNELVKTTSGVRGSDANRINKARAIASHILYTAKVGQWTFTPGVRMEDITLERLDYGSTDPQREGTDRQTKANQLLVWIPGMGANYRLNNMIQVFGGIHKGFSPPSITPGQKAEKSINYELGTRFDHLGVQGEIVGYYNDYQNLLGSDLSATGGTGSLDQFNAGAVMVSGLEFAVNYDVLQNNKQDYTLPISLTYTLTDTEFMTSFDSSEAIYGVVNQGDEIPYIPKNQVALGVGVEHNKWALNLNVRHRSGFRTRAGSGMMDPAYSVTANTLVDASAHYFVWPGLKLAANVINLFDEVYAASRTPAGLRPGHPFGLSCAVTYLF